MVTTAMRMFTLDTEKNTKSHQFKSKKPRCRTSQRQHFFSHRVNNLPAKIAEAPTMNLLKNILDTAMRSYMYSIEEPPTKIWLKDHQLFLAKVLNIGVAKRSPFSLENKN
jgi:hypothetical protein